MIWTWVSNITCDCLYQQTAGKNWASSAWWLCPEIWLWTGKKPVRQKSCPRQPILTNSSSAKKSTFSDENSFVQFPTYPLCKPGSTAVVLKCGAAKAFHGAIAWAPLLLQSALLLPQLQLSGIVLWAHVKPDWERVWQEHVLLPALGLSDKPKATRIRESEAAPTPLPPCLTLHACLGNRDIAQQWFSTRVKSNIKKS